MTYLSRKHLGFSLIELMVVMAIMAVVMSLTGGLMQRNISQQERQVELEKVKQLFKQLSYKAYYQGIERIVRLEEDRFVLFEKPLSNELLALTGKGESFSETVNVEIGFQELNSIEDNSVLEIKQVINFKHLVFVAQEYKVTTKGLIFPTSFGIQSSPNIQQFSLSSVF